MTDRMAKLLDVLEHGTQQTDEPSYGWHVPDGYCWRCVRRPALDGPAGVCAICRAVLLCDLPDQPAAMGTEQLAAYLADHPEAAAAAMQAIKDSLRLVARAFADVARQVGDALAAFAALIETPEPASSPVERARRAHRPCPRHGDTSMHGGLCRACARSASRGRENRHGHR